MSTKPAHAAKLAKILSVTGSQAEISFPNGMIMTVSKAMLKQFGVPAKAVKAGAEFAC